MKDTGTSSTAATIGLDLGDRYTHLCVVDQHGKIVEETRFTTTKPSFTKHFQDMEPIRIAIEACVHSPWVSRLLEGLGHEVLVSNPRRMRLI